MMRCSPSAAFAFAFLLPATPALSLTPEEAWAGLQAMMSSSGQTIAVESTNRAGDTLTISGISLSLNLPDSPAISSKIPSLTFRDRGDGSVEIGYPAAYDTSITFPDDATGGPKSVVLTFTHDQMVILASGAADAPRYDFTAKTLTVIGKDFVGPDGKTEDVTAVGTMSGMEASYLATTSGTALSYDTTATADSFAVTFNANDPDEGTKVSGSLSVTDIALSGKTLGLDPLLAQTNMPALLAAGFMVDAKMTSGPTAFTMDVQESGKTGAVNASFTGTSVSVFLDKDKLDYGYGLTGGTIQASGFDIPLPQIASSFGEIALRFAMPVSASEEAQPFAALVKLVDLTVTEDIWAMVDPGQQLPRDPVTFIVDLAGTGAWTVDILDPAAQMDSGPDLPAKLFTLDLTQVLAKAAGAQVAAVGGLTFDNANLQAFGGFPAPLGKITFTLTGINALLDALVAIGVVPEQELMSVRMGLAMLAKPGAGPDELISEIEFREGGSLFVNGQQMQ